MSLRSVSAVLVLLNLSTHDSISSFRNMQMQSTCMENAVWQRVRNAPNKLRNALTKNIENPNDICAWRGVTCENDEVKGFVFSGRKKQLGPDFCVKWLPPICEHLHMVNIRLRHPLRSAELPRNLRYLYLASCHCPNSLIIGRDNVVRQDYGEPFDEVFDFRRLPHNMEEFHVVDGWIAGTLCIDWMPFSMRVLQVLSYNVKKVLLGDKYSMAGPKAFDISEREGDVVQVGAERHVPRILVQCSGRADMSDSN